VSRLRSLVDALWYALLTACLCAVLGLVGYGLVGYGLNPGEVANIALQTLGIASPAAIPPLLVPWTITYDDDFDATIRFMASGAGVAFNAVGVPGYTSFTTADDIGVKLIFHGFTKSPATK